ncbi:post-GPI attachment to proteins factor 6-like isoform X2 [Polyodon spathula]|uniref:post-GPI attachment to proteins factor 6-like isoform X2 n=1 Tax=Polyodon spathula TaxID=7913 RepID=UPI001B7F50E2|nr:post-GPI attachment to proteins factor 6-like isoform X2 [Polyodon spathula]
MKKRGGVCLLVAVFLASCCATADDLTYVSEFYSKVPQKLSRYSWYGNVRLLLFKVPQDSVFVRFQFTGSRDAGATCANTTVTVHIRAGAPPVINPLATQFSENAAFTLAHNFSLMLGSAGPNMTFFNLTNPAVGDWFIAAHLPKDDGKIEPKGLSSSCSYFFQPQMFVRRVIDMPVLEPGVPLQQTVSSPSRPAVLKVFIPAYTAEMTLQLGGCRTGNSTADSCPLVLTLGSAALTLSSPKIINCSGQAECPARLHSPPWESWVRITVESLNSNLSTSFQITAALTAGCKPKSSGLFGDFLSRFSGVNGTGLFSNATLPVDNATALVQPQADSLLRSAPSGDSCLRSQPVFKEDVDVVSVRFALINGPNISISSQAPTLISLNLNSGADSGGTLVLDLRLNQTSLTHGNASVLVCVNAGSPVLTLNQSQSCTTAFSQGYSLRMNGTSPEAALHIPFPETALWYLTLHTVCPADASACGKVSGTVLASSVLSACVNDCGTYGECRLLRSYGYLYAACTCKAGQRGWSCSDAREAQSYARQMLAALLLTLSNLMFIPPIVVAVYRYHIVEASVYLFTMFFSTFYHACDQPGITVMCIMDYDTLQYCDFLGSVSSIWVTILCMARIKDVFKYIYRGVRRRQCYPTTWKRWLFFLLPGIVSAVIGISLYVFAQTDENYLYTHSAWHMLVASSVVFLLPPREKHKKPWGWSQQAICGYQICKNEQEEVYTVP